MEYKLFETMLLYKDSIFLFYPHLQRLCGSAKILGFAHDGLESFLHLPIEHGFTFTLPQSLRLLGELNIPNISLESTIKSLESCIKNTEYKLWSGVGQLAGLLEVFKTKMCKNDEIALKSADFMLCRLILSKKGILSCTFSKLHPICNTSVKLTKAEHKITPLSHHKTTQRFHFDEAAKSIDKNECFDYLYHINGRLMEGSRSNILIAKNGKYYTPESSVGLLSGTLRNIFISCGICTEKILYERDLYEADSIYCLNSVRGLVPVFIKD